MEGIAKLVTADAELCTADVNLQYIHGNAVLIENGSPVQLDISCPLHHMLYLPGTYVR